MFPSDDVRKPSTVLVPNPQHYLLNLQKDFDHLESSLPAATRGLLATDHVILNHGQVTWTTPELAPPSPNYHTTPTGGRFSSRQIERASLPYTAGL
ncbi:hypothetical protein TNCV_92731 [Trichonephila clavipes]|nr:hypothetical protein TNCV_92731 [Trichonephila clavipes]